jgi:single-stranded-DNA-specific exonuclease
MNKRWTIANPNQTKTDDLHNALKINKTLCSILVNRGFDTFEKAKYFFRPELSNLHDPFLMKDMQKAVDRLLQAFTNKEKILVFGDYDVDGTTSVALMYQFLCSIYNADFLDFYIPDRYKEGYGVSKAGIDFAKTNGFTLIVSLDCGIKSVELVAYAKSIGVAFIICDHHLPDEVVPDAVAILNAKQTDCNYPFKELCGCGVGFKLAQALCATLQLPDDLFLKYLDLLATAIAADIVPMVGENRIMAYYGLQKINQNPCVGINTLKTLSKVPQKLSITDVVFMIAPRINAAGRMDDAKTAVRLFIETDATKAQAIASALNKNNQERREADETITESALEQILEDKNPNEFATVVYNENWHKGVVGIVASRLIDKYYRPTIVLTKSGDYAAGSARSIAGFNLYEAIHACRAHLMAYGGHFAAAGLTIKPENIPAFKKQFEAEVQSRVTPQMMVPEVIIDAPIQLEEINQALFNIIAQMEPFGPENMQPHFVARGLVNNGQSKIVKDKHIRFVVTQGNKTLTGIGFNLAYKFNLMPIGTPFDAVFKITENEWQDKVSLQIQVYDIKAAEKL